MSPPRVLLTCPTGYIGGSILHQLATSTDPAVSGIPVTVLLRGEERAAKITERYGAERVTCVQLDNFDNAELLAEQASRHDVVIHAFGFHPGSAEALVRGLAKGREGGAGAGAGEGAAGPAWMIQTSGCSNIADKPLTGQAHPEREHRDAEAEAVYEFEKAENAREWYPQRAAELAALDASMETGGRVRAMSVQIPNIRGTGEGLFQRGSLIVPIMMGWVLEKGYGFYLGDHGGGVIDHVHVSDLAALFVLLVRRIAEDPSDEALPHGRRGIVFPTDGRYRLREVAQGCLDAAFEAGALPRADGTGPREKEIRQISLEEAAGTTAGNAAVAEAGWAGHRLTLGTVARGLGWRPRRGGEADLSQEYRDELQAALTGQRGVTIGNCIDARDA